MQKTQGAQHGRFTGHGAQRRHCRLTVSPKFTNVTRFIQRVVNL